MKMSLKSPSEFMNYGHLMKVRVKPKVTKLAEAFVKRIY
jgi:hypothetical protein